MVIKQGFAQINYQNYSGTIDPRYESEIVILVYNKEGILIASSYNYTGTSIDKRIMIPPIVGVPFLLRMRAFKSPAASALSA